MPISSQQNCKMTQGCVCKNPLWKQNLYIQSSICCVTTFVEVWCFCNGNDNRQKLATPIGRFWVWGTYFGIWDDIRYSETPTKILWTDSFFCKNKCVHTEAFGTFITQIKIVLYGMLLLLSNIILLRCNNLPSGIC